jgi:peptidoglycan-N-acetylmuramic acid deacetylase
MTVVAELPGPSGPDCMEVLADGKTLLVSSRWARKLSFIDIETNAQGGAPGAGGQVAARRVDAGPCAALITPAAACWLSVAGGCSRAAAATPAACDKPVYLTFDTGHMGVAPLVAEVLQRQQVPVTFFLANERTQTRTAAAAWTTLGALVEARGRPRAMPSARTPGTTSSGSGRPARRRLRRRPPGPAGRQAPVLMRRAGYCAELQRPAARFQAMTGQPMLPLFRAPGGKTSPALLAGRQGLRLAARGLGAGRLPGRRTAQRPLPERQLLARRCATSAPATSCWRTWASGRARTPGRRRCWSRWCRA